MDGSDERRTDEEQAQREVWGPDPGKQEDADRSLRNTARQMRGTSLEGTPTSRSLEELGEAAERVNDEPGYGREGK